MKNFLRGERKKEKEMTDCIRKREEGANRVKYE